MQDVFIVDAVRTPFGKRNGALEELHAQDLAAKPLEALEARTDFTESGYPEDVIYGCVTPIGARVMCSVPPATSTS